MMKEKARWTKRPDAAFSRPTAEQRTDAVLRLATQLFNQHGIGGTTLDEVALGLGIRKASLYNYIDSKSDLIFQCLMRTMQVRAHVMDVAEKVKGKAIVQLEAYLDEFRRVLWDSPGMFPLMAFYEYPAGYVASREGKKSDPIVHRELDRMIAMFNRGLKDGSLRKGEPNVLIHAFESPFVGLTRWYREEEHGPGSDIHATLNQFIIEGLRRRT